MTQLQFNTALLSLQDKLLYYALSLTSDQEKAQDLLQETFLKALTYRDKFTQNTNFKAWIYTIMKNTFINDYRRRSKRQTLFSEDVHEFVINSRPADLSPDQEFGFREITSIVNNLQPEFRVPFQMHNNGYKYQEIAEELGLHLGTVKSRIHFSRKKLMEKIDR